MSKVLIGVGGSGQHVVHAYLRMLALTACHASDVPHVYIVDADARTGEAGLCSDIAELHRRLVKPLSQENRPRFALIRPYFERYPDSNPDLAYKNLELDDCPKHIKDIFLVDDPVGVMDDSANDLTVDLLQGMMANAKVGAMAFGFKIMRVGSDRSLIDVNFGAPDRSGKTTFNLLSDVKNARVAVIGSSFGGTGSGVIPAMVRYLTSQAGGRPAAVRAFMTLPWFEIEAGGNSAAAIQAGGIDPKKRNAALGLRTYLSELENAAGNSNYVVAQFLGESAVRKNRGNYNQGEDPHVFNLVLATSVQSFLLESTDTGAVAGGGQGRRKLFSMFTDKPEEVTGIFSAEHSAHLRFRVKPDDNRQLLDIVKEAELLALVLEKGAEFITPGANQFRVEGAVRQTEPDGLIELCKNIAVSYEKIPLEKKGMLFKKKEVAPDEVYKKLAEALCRAAETIRQSLLWVDDHKKADSRLSGVEFPPLGHLFDIQQSGHEVKILSANENSLRKHWDAYGLKIIRKESKDRHTELTDATECISQAFALFMNCFYSNKNFVDELKSLAKNQTDAPIYEIAAQMLADAVFAEVVEVRAASRAKDKLRDAQDNARTIGNLTAFIKGVMVNPESDGSRLCVLSKSMLDGTVGDVFGANQNPIHEDHPLSLRQIDPYLGISKDQNYDISAVTKLKLPDAGAWFPETALKGIPNVIAPLLLQEWRLNLNQPEAGDTDGIYEEMKGVRLNQKGLFQHATKVVEAGFWLIFSKDSRIKLVNLETDKGLQNSEFCKLVHKELKAHRHFPIENALPKQALVLANGKDAGRVVLVADPHCGWYLPANWVARRFFGNIMPELPSVKYGKSRLDQAWSGYNAPKKLEKGSFDANLIAGFYESINHTLKNEGTSQALWTVALREIAASIGHLGLELCSLPLMRGESFQLETGANGEIGEVRLFVPKALDHINKLLVEKPVYFFVGDETQGTDSWNGLWPIKGAAWEYVVPPETAGTAPVTARCTVPREPLIDQRSAWEISNLRLNLRNLGIKDYKFPFGITPIPGSSESTEQLPWAAAIWPNFKAEDWTCYYAGGVWESASKILSDFDNNGTSFKTDEWELRFYGDIFSEKSNEVSFLQEEAKPNPTFGLIGTVRKQMPTKLNGVPRAVELLINDRIMGSMPIILKPLPENIPRGRCDVAIDFGTSNTCMAIKEEGKESAEHLPLVPGEKLFGIELPDITVLLGPNKAPAEKHLLADKFFKTPRAPIFFFQSFNKRKSSAVPGSIPSELINLRSKSYPGQTDYLEKNMKEFEKKFGLDPEFSAKPQTMRQAVVTPHFTPFPPDPGGLEDTTELALFLGAGLQYGFKWPALAGDGTDNYGFRAVYLEQILMAACASLRYVGVKDVSRFVGTYPAAFEDMYRDTYKNHLSKLVKACFGLAGIKLIKEKDVLMKSETVSSLASINIGKDICVSIDMGGGTTDVGYVIPDMKNKENDFFSFMSCVKYAGNDLLRALVKLPSLEHLLGDATDSDEIKFARLTIMIRRGELLNKPSVSQVARAFFEALFEYVFSILTAIATNDNFPKDKRINVYLFGNGFKLLNVFLGIDADTFLTELLNDLKSHGFIAAEIAERISLVHPPGDTKLALIEGALYGKVGGCEPSEYSSQQKLLHRVEAEGHGRVAIWYPCIWKPSGTVEVVTLGTEEERKAVLTLDSNFRDNISIDTDNIEALKNSFPITSKYWKGTNALTAIFNNAPHKNLIALGSYYLEGREGVMSSFARVVLPVIAANSSHNVQNGNF